MAYINSMAQLPINRYHKEYFPVEIIEMHNPQIVHSVREGEVKELQLFKYTIVDAYGNRGELISWHKHIGYRTGERIKLKNFLVKEFRGEKQIVALEKTDIILIGN